MAKICVLLDKFNLLKIVKTKDFCMLVMKIASFRLIYVGKKSLKGAEQFNEKSRGASLTGDQVLRLVGCDFCRTCCLMSMIIIKVEMKKPIVNSMGT